MRTAILKDVISGVEVKVHATTDHPTSSYGLPVWVDDKGEAYCQVDTPSPFYKITELYNNDSSSNIVDDNPDDYIGDYYDPWKKHFHVVIGFADGNMVDAKVVARNSHHAVYLLKQQQVYKDFAGNTTITSETVDEIQIEPIINNRFSVSKVDNKMMYYVVSDHENMLGVEFLKYRYNERQRVIQLGKGKQLTAIQAATALREIGEFMFLNFKEIACKPKKQHHRYMRDSFGNNDNFSDFDANDNFNNDNNNA